MNPAPRSCGVTGCIWSTSKNNSTVALMSQEFTDHMTMHTLNQAIADMSRGGMERRDQPIPEQNGAARNVVVKQRNAPSYGREMELQVQKIKKLSENFKKRRIRVPVILSSLVPEVPRRLAISSSLPTTRIPTPATHP